MLSPATLLPGAAGMIKYRRWAFRLFDRAASSVALQWYNGWCSRAVNAALNV